MNNRSPLGLFLGLSTLDLQFSLPSYPRSNTKQKADQAQVAVGGPAANAAATFQHLGGTAHLFSVVGQHALTPVFLQDVQDYGLHLTDLSPTHGAFPPLASILTSADNGDRTIVSTRVPPPKLEVSRLWDQLEGLEAQVILLDGFYLPAALELAKWGRPRGIPVVLDGGSWKQGLETLLPWVDVAICSADFRVPSGNVMDYLGSMGIAHIAITRGANAISYQSAGEQGQVAVPSLPVVDTLGAGDVFHGAFCYYFGKGQEVVASLVQATTIAGRSCQYLGARSWMHPPTSDDHGKIPRSM